MSRTYRTHMEWKYRALERDWTVDECRNVHSRVMRGWSGFSYLERRGRDKKPWNKPARFFKAMKRRIERARVRVAIRNERDIPVFRKSDQYDWT